MTTRRFATMQTPDLTIYTEGETVTLQIQAIAQDCADEIRIGAWRAMRFDDLHSSPKALAEAIDDSTYRQSPGALEDLLCALTSRDENATAADNLMIQHQAAVQVIERLVQEVVDAEEKRGLWRQYDE